MFEYVALSDGVDTAELTDTRRYALQSYGPTVAPLRDSLLGGPPYSDVADQLTVHALGCTASEAYEAAQLVDRLLDTARRWARGENVRMVTLKLRLKGSTTTLTTVVKGRAPGGAPHLALNVVEDQALSGYIARNLSVQFVRLGQLLLPTTESASAAAAANPAKLTVTLPSSHSIPSPIQLDLTGWTTSAGSGTIDIPGSFVTLTPQDGTYLVEAESIGGVLASGATYTSTADTAARASNGAVGRLNYSLASTVNSRLDIPLPTAFRSATRIGVLCTYRNNGNSAWLLRASGSRVTVGANIVYTGATQIAAGASNPTALMLGVVASRYGFDVASIHIERTVIGSTPTLDFDTFLIVDLSTPESFILNQQGSGFFDLGAAHASKSATVTIDHDPLGSREVEVRSDILTTTGVLPIGYQGDPHLTMRGSVAEVVWYGTHLSNGLTPYWRTQNTAGSATLSIGATIARRKGYLVPL